jgi:hypothetical protein
MTEFEIWKMPELMKTILRRKYDGYVNPVIFENIPENFQNFGGKRKFG